MPRSAANTARQPGRRKQRAGCLGQDNANSCGFLLSAADVVEDPKQDGEEHNGPDDPDEDQADGGFFEEDTDADQDRVEDVADCTEDFRGDLLSGRVAAAGSEAIACPESQCWFFSLPLVAVEPGFSRNPGGTLDQNLGRRYDALDGLHPGLCLRTLGHGHAVGAIDKHFQDGPSFFSVHAHTQGGEFHGRLPFLPREQIGVKPPALDTGRHAPPWLVRVHGLGGRLDLLGVCPDPHAHVVDLAVRVLALLPGRLHPGKDFLCALLLSSG